MDHMTTVETEMRIMKRLIRAMNELPTDASQRSVLDWLRARYEEEWAKGKGRQLELSDDKDAETRAG